MARYTEARCRLCRRENLKLFLKGSRCYSDQCAFERRAYAPGQHGQKRAGKHSDYKIQLREKQKVKRIYGLLEAQFRLFYERAEKQKGATGGNLLILLERRLDNVVFRLGFASSRAQARQFVRHGHILVNGEKVDIPSYLVSPGDKVGIAEKSKEIPAIKESLETVVRRDIPKWLELDRDKMEGMVKSLPVREDINIPVQEHLIVELYSK